MDYYRGFRATGERRLRRSDEVRRGALGSGGRETMLSTRTDGALMCGQPHTVELHATNRRRTIAYDVSASSMV